MYQKHSMDRQHTVPQNRHISVENDAIAPIEDNIYIIYHDPTKQSFKYDQKTATN